MMQLFIEYGFYDVWWHFLFYLFIACHICLLVEVSPLQVARDNWASYWIAILVSSAVPSILTSRVGFATLGTEILAGMITVSALSLVLTLSLPFLFRRNHS